MIKILNNNSVYNYDQQKYQKKEDLLGLLNLEVLQETEVKQDMNKENKTISVVFMMLKVKTIV